MNKKIIVFLMMMAGSILAEETNYVYFNANDSRVYMTAHKATYNYNNGSLNMDDKTLMGINWDIVKFGSFIGTIPTNSIISTNELPQITEIQPKGINNRKQMLISLVAIYKDFLKNEWTTILRTKGIIAGDYEITVSNTDSGQNMIYLMTLRTMDTETNKPTYSYYKNEFETFRDNIERLGGSMGNL